MDRAGAGPVAVALGLAPTGLSGAPGALGALTPGAPAAAVYSDPGPMPPVGTAACAAQPSAPCATQSQDCSHIVAPAVAYDGEVIELRTNPATPCNAWTFDELPGEQLSACYLPDTSGGGGGYVTAYGNEPLNVCAVRVDTGTLGGQIYRQNPATGAWETTNGPGWVKVGVNDICGYACTHGYSAEDETWMAIIPPPPLPTPPPTTTTPAKKPPPGLALAFSPSPSPVVVPQTAAGATPRAVALKVTVTNTGTTPVTNVAFADPLHITPVGHIPVGIDITGCARANANGITPAKGHTPAPCPIEQSGKPKSTAVGTLAPGASASITYPLTVRGDGDYTVYGQVSGTRTDSQGNTFATPSRTAPSAPSPATTRTCTPAGASRI